MKPVALALAAAALPLAAHAGETACWFEQGVIVAPASIDGLAGDYIVDTVRDANEAVQIRVLENFSTGYHARNGGGDSIRTDGNLPVIDVRGLA